MPAREALECCKQIDEFLVKSQNISMLMRMHRLKARLRRFQLELRTPLAVGPEAMCVTLWQKISLCFAHVLSLAGD